MKDFVNWCYSKQLIDVFDDGTVAWKEAAVVGPGHIKHTEKFKGGRDGRDDLSSDYKDYVHKNGTVWPYKVVAKGKSGKKVADVAK